MLVDGRVYKVLEFDDLNSLVSFKEWLKNHLTLYFDDEKIPDHNIKVFLEYIKNQSKDQKVKEKREWFDKLDSLIERVDEG